MRFLKTAWLLFLILLVCSGTVALAVTQGGEEVLLAIQIDWQYVVSLLINSVLVVLAVQLLKKFLPELPDSAKQILALVAGPLLMWGQTALSTALGYPIDFGPLIELFAGLTSAFAAMGLFDIGKRARVLKGG